MNIKKIQLWLLSGALFCTLLTHAIAQEAYSSVGPNYGKLYNSTGSASTPNYGANTNPSDRVAAQQSGLGYSQPATTVNQGTASANVPGYTNTPPSGLTSGFAGTSLFPQGKSNITRCAATGSGSTNTDPECNAVNFLANNPSQKITLSPSDPMLKTGADIISNASTVSPTNSRTCNYQNQAVAGTNSTETCNDYYNAYTSTCTKVLNQSYGYSTLPFSINPGSQVSPWSARTFSYSVQLNGIPRGVMLNRYQVDNYGQIWVNGNVVMSNILPGMTDLRNGYISSNPWTCDDNGCYGGDTIFVNADGSSTGFYDDGCNWGCRGTNPNIDVSSYFHAGTNEIVIACVNANAIGPCAVDISMQAYGIIGSSWTNNCQSQEALVK